MLLTRLTHSLGRFRYDEKILPLLLCFISGTDPVRGITYAMGFRPYRLDGEMSIYADGRSCFNKWLLPAAPVFIRRAARVLRR